MTTVGSGPSGSLGGPAIPMQRDLEASAWTEVNKAALGIVYDSIEKVLTDLNPRYSTGYLGGFGYKSTSSNPLLDHPLESSRFPSSNYQSTATIWTSVYENLINNFPPDVLARFNLEANKPFELRSLNFIALDNVIQTAAKFIAQAEELGSQPQASSLEGARTILNLLLPFAALRGAYANSSEVLQAAQQFLANQGANYQYFDGFNNLFNQLESPLNLLAFVDQSLNDTVNGQLSSTATAAAAKAARQLAALGTSLETISLGSDLQMMRSTIYTLELVATSLSLQNTHTAPLFIALSLASIGIFTSQSSAGILGPSMEALILGINQGLNSNLMASNNKAGNDLLSMATTLSFAAFISLSTLALDTGLGIFPGNRDPSELGASKFFAFETALLLASSAGFLETFYKEILAVSGGNEQAQLLGGSTLSQLAILLIILSNPQSNRFAQLIENEAAYLNQGMTSAAALEKALEENPSAAIALQLAFSALESKDYEGFLNALNNGLESLGTSQESLTQDLSKLKDLSSIIVNLSTMQNDENTHIVNII